MRFQQTADGWMVTSEPNEIRLRRGVWPYSGLLGFINHRGTIRVSYPTSAPRDWGQVARYMLEDARRELWERGDLRNPAEQRKRREEAKRGDFIARLDDGRSRRFYSFRSGPERGAMARPGALDWIDAEIGAGRASYGEIFRGEPPAIYTEPRVLPAQAGYGAMTIGEHAHFPIQVSRKDEYGWVRSTHSPSSLRAYDLKASAMRLVDQRAVFGGDGPAPEDVAAAWAVAGDAFEEARNPFQAEYARKQTDFWDRRSRVSSRRPAKARRRRS